MIVPIKTYGSEIWGFKECEEIERIQVRFCQFFLGNNSTVNNGKCGRLPLSIVYHTKCIKYWCKILQLPNNRYPRNCYNMFKS